MGLHLGLALGNAQPVGPASSITIDTAPAITGTAEVGETLTRTVGSYSGDGTITVSNGRWTRNGVDIAGATGATYTLVAADDQTTVRWYEDVADAGSGDTLESPSNGKYVTYAAPVEDAAPTASGDAVIGESLTGTSGTFTGSNLTEGDEWEVSDDGATGWTGTGDTDTTGPAMVSGKHYRFASTASNSGGTLTTYSSVIGPAIAPTISMAGLSGGEAVEGSHASITMSANIGTITARKWGSTSGGSQYGTGTNPTDFTGGTTLYATATVGGVDYTTFATIAEDTTPALSATLDSEMEIDGSGDISLTVTAPSDYAGGPYTTDQSTAATGNLNTASIETGPQCAVVPAISRTSGASDTVGAVYTRVSGLWLYDGDDTLTLAGEWYLDGVATGETGATYTSDTAGDVDWRDSISGAGATRTAISNEITVAAAPTVPAQMSAPTVTAVSDTEISVDLAAAPDDGGSTITSYDLRHSTDESTWTTVNDVSDPETVSGLTASTLYYVQTRAVNAVGAGAWSASDSATTDAASGILWDDQFLASQSSPMPSYSIGDRLTADTSGAYIRNTGFQYVKVYDLSGTRAIQLDDTQTQEERVLYDETSVSDDRIVTFGIERMPTFSSATELLCHFVDTNNRIYATVQPDGNWSARVQIAGSLEVNAFITASDLADGAELSIENDTAAETVSFKVDGVHVAGSPFSVTGGVTGLGAPGFFLKGNTTGDNLALSRFAIEET